MIIDATSFTVEMLERNGRTEAIVLVMVARLQYLRFCLFEMYVNVVFVIRCLYSTVGLTLVKKQRFIRFFKYLYIFNDDDDDDGGGDSSVVRAPDS